ncbi:hypothetical protein OH768_32590 [Streptomyces sp. NBC_01622]|uniref:fascin domain-containing protein n=1 Tax=Streptomyces sp. NBC_01622 TaxID=2975903 RepID=UPI00386FCD21|nr:hypothetical protein OH768_32590 [Streptomyces sp. NBC_01622]
MSAVCTIKTTNGHYLTAVDEGGHTTNAIQSDRTVASTREKFTLVPAGDSFHYGFRSSNGNYLSAVGGGGVANADSIHTDATLSNFGSWEEFQIDCTDP